MKDLHTFGWYAKRLTPHLPKYAFKPVPARLWGGLAYLAIVVAGILAIGVFDLHITLNLGIAIVLGASFAGMGFLGHEILHGTVVRKAWLRNFLGAVAFWPLSTGPRLWRKWHNLTHHVHTQNEEHDPDAWPTLEKLAQSRMLRWIYRLPFWVRAIFGFLTLSIQFTAHSFHMFLVYIKEFNPKKRPAVWFQFILPWVTWLGLMFWIGPVKWLFAFLIPLLIANLIVMGYISTNHRLNPITPVNDPLANSLSVTVPKWVDVLHFNFSYHTEHHVFPGMSPKYYPMVKEQIKRMWPERYHEMPMGRALTALIKTPRVYYREKDLVDPRGQKVYGSLGHGLDPVKIKPQKGSIKETASKLKIQRQKEKLQ
ncbi:fatty acid desaturase family protein [Bacillus marinisedimentorum]|uniref:fatty acid desaturase family protein n=1 Tax=Bacillus marinisedimentorum TaxID=1821260 RepID=UPI0007DE8093|nr:acyl-CoA desaturase [Bacillus marinisedimentorum]